MLTVTERPEFKWLGAPSELDRWMDKHVPPPVEYVVLPDGVLRVPGHDGRPVDAKVGATKFVIVDDE